MYNSKYIPKKDNVPDDMPQYEPFDPAPGSLTPRGSMNQAKNSVFHQMPINDQMENLNLGRKNLSQDLEVVVLMMSVEIEKLKRQNQQQNNRMKDSQTSQMDKDQISRLLDENLRLKQQLQSAQEQTEQWKYKYSQVDFSTQGKHDQVSQKLFETELQLNEFKNKYYQMEKLKDMEIEQQKQQQEQRRKSLLNREIRELTLKFQADKAALVAENQKLTNIIDLRGQEIDELTQNLEQMDSTMNNNSSINMKSFEMEQKLASQKKELELSNYNLSIKTQQIDQYRNQIRDLEFKISQFENVNGDLLRQKESQLMEMSLMCSNQQKKLDEYRNMDQIIQDLNKNNEFLVQENNKLNNQLVDKHQSLENLQINHNLAQQELNKLEASSVHQRDRLNFLVSENDKLNIFLQKEKDVHKQSQLKLQQYEQDQQVKEKRIQINRQIGFNRNINLINKWFMIVNNKWDINR